MAAKKQAKTIAYKGFDKDWQCRGFKFEVGKTYKHKGKVVACESGFHACESPFDVWGYYDVTESKFAVVELSGEQAKHGDDTKIAAAEITIKAELTLPEFIKTGIDWLLEKTKGGDLNDNGGHSARIGSSGDSARIGSSGNYAQIGSSGHYAQIGSSGDSARIGSSGHYAQIGSSGDSAQIGATGENAVIACAAHSTVKAGKNGCFTIPYYDGNRTRFAIGYVGEDGIKPDTWYTVRDGKIVEAS